MTCSMAPVYVLQARGRVTCAGAPGRGDGYTRMNDNGGLATGISRQIAADLSVLCTLAPLDGVRATVALQEECHDDVAAGVMTKSTADHD